MKRLFLTFAALCAFAVAEAQVSYLEMVEMRGKRPDYINPASLTPLAGTDKYMELDGKRVVVYDYSEKGLGDVVFSSDELLMSYVKSPDGTMALYVSSTSTVWVRSVRFLPYLIVISVRLPRSFRR